MGINIIYILVFFIFLFLIYLIIKSIKSGMDGKNKKKIYLSKPSQAILIPTMIWSTQKFLIKNSVLIALCSKKFSEKDYIRDIKIFNKLTKASRN